MRLIPILVALSLAATAGAAPRAGKVVRVERRSQGITGNPRVCTVHAGDWYGGCAGDKAPEVGERLTAIDQNRVLGSVRITTVTPATDGCSEPTSWTITVVADSGDFSLAHGNLTAVSDVPLDVRSARMINVDKAPSGQPWSGESYYAIDDHGDGSVDVEFIQFNCDDAGNPTITAPTGMCYEVWAQQNGKSLERIRSSRVKSCY
jgi:hypothetical protein